MFSLRIFEADSWLKRRGAGGLFSETFRQRSALRVCPVLRFRLLRNIGASAHAELVERARADHPSIPLAVRYLASLFCLAFIHAEAAASLKGSVGYSFGGPGSHAVGPERASLVLACPENTPVAVDAHEAVFVDSFQCCCHNFSCGW